MKKIELMILISEAMLDDGLEANTEEFVKMYKDHGFSIDTVCEDRLKKGELQPNCFFFSELLPKEDRLGFNYIYKTILKENLEKDKISQDVFVEKLNACNG